jgi:hypothetical protein
MNLRVIDAMGSFYAHTSSGDERYQQTRNETTPPLTSSRYIHKHRLPQMDVSDKFLAATENLVDRGTASQNDNEQDVLERTTTEDEDVHLVFSTGCSVFQDWQSYGFFFQAWYSGHKGHVTRVASGCEGRDAEQILLNHDRLIVRGMSDRFHLHLTPDYSKTSIPGVNYKFFNKPMGLRHWMEQGLGFKLDQSDSTKASNLGDAVFVILDPDQFVTRPFRREYRRDAELWVTMPLEATVKVERGKPVAQLYGFGARWIDKINATFVLNSTTVTSGLKSWTRDDVAHHYAAGPPYMAVGSDMYEIVRTWAEMAVPVYQLTENHLSEMFAYSVAAAHLKLPHQLARSFMLSDISTGEGEAWAWVDEQSAAQVCRPQPASKLPLVIHYCQRYFLGPYFFSKYQVPKSRHAEFLSCKHELFALPPTDDIFATMYNSSVTLDGNRHDLNPQDAQRMAYMLCQMLPRMNAMARYYKNQECPIGTANLNATFFFKQHKKS